MVINISTGGIDSSTEDAPQGSMRIGIRCDLREILCLSSIQMNGSETTYRASC
ncbi:MAG: hypothetical protein ACJZ9K_02190 [Alphaproteobacteria bacterium]